ncbi:MAG: DUF1553 domain-containing protein, partial [Planctomycetales bacterium]|nr:DUF1553 domain-containing protein [Planctomycetales bacterium]
PEQNPYFSKAIVNRVWAAFHGKGIVNPVDDLRISNPASNERLLEELAQDLQNHAFDLKHLMRVILNSETYQRSSQPLAGNEQDEVNFSRYYARRLDAEILLDAIAQVTGVPSRFVEIGYDGSDVQKTDDYPVGTRALELHDSAIVSGFLDVFGRNARDITCECERSNTPSIVQALHLSNGDTINERLADPNSCVTATLTLAPDWRNVIRVAYLRTLSRQPTDSELEQLTAEIAGSDPSEQRAALEDLYWGLMSSREFLFNH